MNFYLYVYQYFVYKLPPNSVVLVYNNQYVFIFHVSEDWLGFR